MKMYQKKILKEIQGDLIKLKETNNLTKSTIDKLKNRYKVELILITDLKKIKLNPKLINNEEELGLEGYLEYKYFLNPDILSLIILEIIFNNQRDGYIFNQLKNNDKNVLTKISYSSNYLIFNTAIGNNFDFIFNQKNFERSYFNDVLNILNNEIIKNNEFIDNQLSLVISKL